MWSKKKKLPHVCLSNFRIGQRKGWINSDCVLERQHRGFIVRFILMLGIEAPTQIAIVRLRVNCERRVKLHLLVGSQVGANLAAIVEATSFCTDSISPRPRS